MLLLKKVPQDLKVVVTENKNAINEEAEATIIEEETIEVDVVKVAVATELNVEEGINASPHEHLSFFYKHEHFFDVVPHLL